MAHENLKTIYCAFDALILGEKQLWDLTTGKSASQTLIQISHLYVVKKARFAQKFAQQFFLSLNLKTALGSS